MNTPRAGLTSLLVAGSAAWAVVANASSAGVGAADHVVSAATLAGIDVDARVRTYALAVAVFALVLALARFGLRRFADAVGADVAESLEDVALGGVLLLGCAALGSAQLEAFRLFAALAAAFVIARVLDVRVFRRDLHPHAGSAFALLAAGAYGVVAATPARGAGDGITAAVVAGFALGAHVTLQLVTRTVPTGRRADRILVVFAGLAWVPLALFVREELRLGGFHDSLATLTSGVPVLGAALFVARRHARGERLDAERALARVALPAVLLGLSCAASWVVVREPMRETFEVGNAGLTIQQWFEHGRWPFFETWSVHGLSDAGPGLLYSLVHGWSGTTWQHWDFVPYALAAVAAYAVLARVMGSGLLAFVIVAASPFTKTLFPPLVVIAVPFTFVAVAAARARGVGTAVGIALAWVGFVAWRLDLGVASLVALITTVVAQRVAFPATRTPSARAVVAFCVTVVVAALVYVGIALARGVDLPSRAADALGILGSNPAFGRTSLASRVDAAVSFRVYAVPALVIAGVVALVLAARRRGTQVEQRTGEGASHAGSSVEFALPALVFLGVFGLVIATRGLVRHTFVENEGDYVTAFGFVVLALAPLVFVQLAAGSPGAVSSAVAPEASARRRVLWAVAIVLHAALPLALRVGQSPQQDGGLRGNLFARATHRLATWEPVAGDASTVERSPVEAEFARSTIEPFVELRRRWLAADETFLDLSGTPMAYVYSGARAPHAWNHLIAIVGDTLQRRFAAEREPWSAPLVIARQDAASAAAANVRADVEIDGVALETWHGYLFAHRVYADHRPFRAAGRFDVWARRDWAAPAGELALTPAAQWEGAAPMDGVDVSARAGESVVVRVTARAASSGALTLTWTRHEEAFALEETRTIPWRAEWTTRDVVLPGEGRAYRVAGLRVGAAAPLVLERVQVGVTDDRDCARAAEHAVAPRVTELGRTALAWGRDANLREQPLATWHAGDAPALEASPDGPSRARVRIDLAGADAGAAERARELELAHAALLVLELESAGAGTTRVTLDYGVGDVTSGTFRFDLPRGARERCVLRPGSQAAWHLRPRGWIELSTDGAPLVVRRAGIARDAEPGRGPVER